MAQDLTLRYRVVDVFTQQPLEGNQLAVFLDAPQGLDAQLMQRIAKELNLSETVFVYPPKDKANAASLRIFTPGREISFAGHPTVGTGWVLLDEGMVPKGTPQFVLEEKIGPIPIRVEEKDGLRIWLLTPRVEHKLVFDRSACAALVGVDVDNLMDIPPQIVTAGNPNLFIPLKTKADVDKAWPDMTVLEEMKQNSREEWLCNFVFTPTPEGAYSRMFAPEHGIAEDPATGSATGPLASYMLKHKLLREKADRHYVSEQGTKMGRRSLLHIHINGPEGSESIEVGGYTTPLIEGMMKLRLAD